MDQKSSGKTALQVASHQGHTEIVKLLVSAGADMETQDEDGDTALHYSAFGYGRSWQNKIVLLKNSLSVR